MRSSTSSLTATQCRWAADAAQRDGAQGRRRRHTLCQAALHGRARRPTALVVARPPLVPSRLGPIVGGTARVRRRRGDSTSGVPGRSLRRARGAPRSGGGGGGRGGRQSRAGPPPASRRLAAQPSATSRQQLVDRVSSVALSRPPRWLGEQVAWTPGDVVAEHEPVEELTAVRLGDLAQLEPAVGVSRQGAEVGSDGGDDERRRVR
jgi:hypothetical protein